jgi:hypothetical protein
MRRIDVLIWAAALLGLGGLVYGLEQIGGRDVPWGQLALLALMLLWVGSYVQRFLTQSMTYHQQLKSYRDAVLRKRWEELTPQEQEALGQHGQE